MFNNTYTKLLNNAVLNNGDIKDCIKRAKDIPRFVESERALNFSIQRLSGVCGRSASRSSESLIETAEAFAFLKIKYQEIKSRSRKTEIDTALELYEGMFYLFAGGVNQNEIEQLRLAFDILYHPNIPEISNGLKKSIKEIYIENIGGIDKKRFRKTLVEKCQNIADLLFSYGLLDHAKLTIAFIEKIQTNDQCEWMDQTKKIII